MDEVLEACFKKKTLIDEKDFISIVESIKSEIFIYIIIFLLEKRPFSKKTLKEFSTKNYALSPVSTPRMVASPKVTGSKFSPVNTMGKSPTITKKLPPKMSSFSKLTDIDPKHNPLSKFGQKIDTKIVDHDYNESNIDQDLGDFDLNKDAKTTIHVKKKERNIFKNIDSIEHPSTKKNQDEDLPIYEGIKTTKKKDKDDQE